MVDKKSSRYVADNLTRKLFSSTLPLNLYDSKLIEFLSFLITQLDFNKFNVSFVNYILNVAVLLTKP